MSADATAQAQGQASTPPVKAPRLISLDAFRGATIAAMMMANNAGDWGHVYGPLSHAHWNGWTFTDTVFPSFLWIVGVAIPFSLLRKMEQGESQQSLFWKSLRRSLLLIAFGLFLNGFPHFDLSTIRVPGVLQRIGICYFVVSVLVLATGTDRRKLAKMCGVSIAALLAVYWILMKFVPVPGYGPGVLEPNGNFSQFIDNLFLNGHMWNSSKTWDPEGTVSTLPAIATCLFGVIGGLLLRTGKSDNQKTICMVGFGAGLIALGEIMNVWLPINKSIWTSSYSVLMAGLDFAAFAVFYWVIDVKRYQTAAKPLAIYGMNAIAVFVLAGLLGRISIEIKVHDAAGKAIALKSYLYNILFGHLATAGTLSPYFASMCWALVYCIGLYFVAHFLYWRKWFLRV